MINDKKAKVYLRNFLMNNKFYKSLKIALKLKNVKALKPKSTKDFFNHEHAARHIWKLNMYQYFHKFIL